MAIKQITLVPPGYVVRTEDGNDEPSFAPVVALAIVSLPQDAEEIRPVFQDDGELHAQNTPMLTRAQAKAVHDEWKAKQPAPPHPSRAQFLALLKSRPEGLNKSTLLDAVDGSTQTKRAALAELVLAGSVLEHRLGRHIVVTLAPVQS